MNFDKKHIESLLDREFTVLDLLEEATFFVAINDSKGYFVSLNKYWVDKLGWSKDELCRKPWMYFLHKDDVQKSMKQYYEGELFNPDAELFEGFENRYKTKDGKFARLEWHSAGKNINGLNLAIAIFKGYEFT